MSDLRTAQVSDTRREGVDVEAIARVLHSRDVTEDDLPEGSWKNAAVRYRYRSMAEAVLAVLPAPPVDDGGWNVTDWEEWANEVAAMLPEDYDGDEAQVEIIAKFVRRAAAPPVVDEETECGRCEQVRPVAWTDDDLVTYCEECVNAIMADLHADIARAPVVDEAEIAKALAEFDSVPWANMRRETKDIYRSMAAAVAARIARGADRD